MERNNLEFTKTYYGNDGEDDVKVVIAFSLNDDCNRGVESFSVKADKYRRCDNNGHYYLKSVGQCYDCIKDQLSDELKNIVSLHMRPWWGGDFHTYSGWYALQRGNYNWAANEMGMQGNEVDMMIACKNERQLQILCQFLGKSMYWETKAKQAVATLERETGDTFVPKNPKIEHYFSFTEDELNEERSRMRVVYYEPDEVEKRRLEKAKEQLGVMLLKEFEAKEDEVCRLENRYHYLRIFVGESEKIIYTIPRSETCYSEITVVQTSQDEKVHIVLGKRRYNLDENEKEKETERLLSWIKGVLEGNELKFLNVEFHYWNYRIDETVLYRMA